MKRGLCGTVAVLTTLLMAVAAMLGAGGTAVAKQDFHLAPVQQKAPPPQRLPRQQPQGQQGAPRGQPQGQRQSQMQRMPSQHQRQRPGAQRQMGQQQPIQHQQPSAMRGSGAQPAHFVPPQVRRQQAVERLHNFRQDPQRFRQDRRVALARRHEAFRHGDEDRRGHLRGRRDNGKDNGTADDSSKSATQSDDTSSTIQNAAQQLTQDAPQDSGAGNSSADPGAAPQPAFRANGTQIPEFADSNPEVVRSQLKQQWLQ